MLKNTLSSIKESSERRRDGIRFMPTLGIFTVKRFVLLEDTYYTYGGFGEYLESMRKRFAKVIILGHVQSGVPAPGWYAIPKGNVELIHFPIAHNELQSLFNIPAMIIRSIDAMNKIDIIHARMPDYTGIVGALLARSYAKPCFHQIVADWYVQARSVSIFKKGGLGVFLKAHLYLYDFVERLVCRNQLVFAQGFTAFQKHRRSSNCHLVLSSAHHESDIGILRPKFLKMPFKILNVARLTTAKNQELLFKIVKSLNQGQEQWHLWIVGEGPRRSELIKIQEEMGLRDCVEFLGQLPRGDALWALYDNADVFVLPSRSEGTPKVILEAMARGLPVAAARVGGVNSMIKHGVNGLLFEDNDQNGLIHCLKIFRSDERLRQACIKSAFSYAREHTIEKETDLIMRIVQTKWPELWRSSTGPTYAQSSREGGRQN